MRSNTVMHQLLLLLPRHQFDQAVSAYGGDAYVKKFSTWNQLTVLLHAQASGKNNLRDIQTALGTQQSKLYHLGLPAVKRSTLANANATRDCRIMEKLFHHLARPSPPNTSSGSAIALSVASADSEHVARQAQPHRFTATKREKAARRQKYGTPAMAPDLTFTGQQ